MSEYKYRKYTDEEKYKYYKSKVMNLTYMIDQIFRYIDSKGLLDELNQVTGIKAEQSPSMEAERQQGRARGIVDYDDIPVIGD
jgi:hypothetical protein